MKHLALCKVKVRVSSSVPVKKINKIKNRQPASPDGSVHSDDDPMGDLMNSVDSLNDNSVNMHGAEDKWKTE